LFVPEAPQQPLGNPSMLWHLFQAGAGSPLTISILAMALALLALVVAMNR